VSRSRLQTFFTVIAVFAGVIAAFVAGLFLYMNATARPIHPDPNGIASAASAPPSPQWADAIVQARQAARAGVTAQNLPGLSVAVGAGGELVWAEGFGWADLDTHVPVRPETRFRVTDASRTLTSAAVGLLLEKKALDLDDEIQTYVPEFPRKQWPVTLRQLMGQVAGVRQDAGDEENLDERCERTADGLKRFAESPLRFEPGTKYRASSYGWILVSAAVEAAADEPFFTFMQKQIFAPLSMQDTTVDVWTQPVPNRATFYYPKFAGDPRYGPEPAREGDYSCFAGAGAFVSTPSDLARFGMAVNGGKLLKPSTVDTLQTPQHLSTGPASEETGYGLGWQIETVPLAGEPARMAGHGSKTDFMGGTTSLMTFPGRGLVVAVMTNTSFADTKSMALKIADAFAERARRSRAAQAPK
jgi:serine beta-lactamase-like protein LACTB